MRSAAGACAGSAPELRRPVDTARVHAAGESPVRAGGRRRPPKPPTGLERAFRGLFSNPHTTAWLLTHYLRWATLTLLPARFVSSEWHDSESDLLFSVEREPDAAPVLLYVLLEHQSSPDRWIRLRVLNIDQTQQSPDSVPGALAARLAQVAMMAAFRQAREELLESATLLIGELYRAMGFDEVAKHVEYVLATQPDEYRSVFVDALRRNVPGRGGDVMNYVEQLIERGRQEGRQEGRREGKLEGQIRTIEGFLERDFAWSSIEAATGIDEAAFRKFKRQLDAADDGAST